MSDRLAKLAGPHGGGYLLLAALPFGFAAVLGLGYLLAVGIGVLVGSYEMGQGWLW